MKRTSTYFPKQNEIHDAWRIIDATGRPLGRMARDIAVARQGKDKPTYTPHLITGDHVRAKHPWGPFPAVRPLESVLSEQLEMFIDRLQFRG